MQPTEDQPASTVHCAMCGRSADGHHLTWMVENDGRRGVLRYCPACSREHLRAIEAKLSPEWW